MSQKLSTRTSSISLALSTSRRDCLPTSSLWHQHNRGARNRDQVRTFEERGGEREGREEGGGARVGQEKCKCCASVVEGIKDVTGVLSPEPSHRYMSSLASRFFTSNRQRVPS